MEDGKSQSWLAYAGCLMKEYGIDYVVKTDTDSVPLLDKYFQYANHNLPPATNVSLLAGHFIPKETWRDYSARKERKFRRNYSAHIYAEGQWYLLSKQLAASTVAYASTEKDMSYLEYVEDHDISTQAFLSSPSIHLNSIGVNNKHWIHPVKQRKRAIFRNTWERELKRTAEIFNYRPYLEAELGSDEIAITTAETPTPQEPDDAPTEQEQQSTASRDVDGSIGNHPEQLTPSQESGTQEVEGSIAKSPIENAPTDEGDDAPGPSQSE